jgi:hypothetical protein
MPTLQKQRAIYERVVYYVLAESAHPFVLQFLCCHVLMIMQIVHIKVMV